MDRVKYDSFFLKPYPKTPLQILFVFGSLVSEYGIPPEENLRTRVWLSLTQGKGTLSHRAVPGKGPFRLQVLAPGVYSYRLLRSNET